MISDWPQTTQKLSSQLRDLRGGAGVADTMKAFSALAQTATKGGALDPKTKELIALAIGVATRTTKSGPMPAVARKDCS